MELKMSILKLKSLLYEWKLSYRLWDKGNVAKTFVSTPKEAEDIKAVWGDDAYYIEGVYEDIYGTRGQKGEKYKGYWVFQKGASKNTDVDADDPEGVGIDDPGLAAPDEEESNEPVGFKCRRNLDNNWLLTILAKGKSYLRPGDCGDAVVTAQNQVNMLITGKFTEDIPNAPLKEDGKYGPNTKKWVKKAQAKLGVSVDGYYGQETNDAIMKATRSGRSPGNVADPVDVADPVASDATGTGLATKFADQDFLLKNLMKKGKGVTG